MSAKQAGADHEGGKTKGLSFLVGFVFVWSIPNETCWVWHLRSQLAAHPHDTSETNNTVEEKEGMEREQGRENNTRCHAKGLRWSCILELVERACFMTVILTVVSMVRKKKKKPRPISCDVSFYVGNLSCKMKQWTFINFPGALILCITGPRCISKKSNEWCIYVSG